MTLKEFMTSIVYFTPSGICAAAGSYMGINGIDGWGWFLFVAVILMPSRVRFGKAAEIDAQRELEESRRESR